MSVLRLTDVADNTRATKIYWDERCEKLWGARFHGHFLDDEQIIQKMDAVNKDVLEGILYDLNAGPIHILECACGIGRYSGFIKSMISAKDSYLGIDFATKNIEEANKLYAAENVKFLEADMALFKTDQKFDLIYMVSVMSSIEQTSQEIINHLRSLLSPGGAIAVFEQDCYYVRWRNG